MDNRYAVLSSGVVVNLILWDGQSNWTPPEGTTVHLIPDDSPVSLGYTFDGVAFAAPAVPPVSLADAKASKAAEINAACGVAITAGFTSSALGTPHSYPAKATDQQNLASSVLASIMPGVSASWLTPFWCADSTGAWGWAVHTAAQIQQVGTDAKAAILACMSKNQQLQDQIAAASDVSSVETITW